jgi:hypothetical protein
VLTCEGRHKTCGAGQQDVDQTPACRRPAGGFPGLPPPLASRQQAAPSSLCHPQAVSPATVSPSRPPPPLPASRRQAVLPVGVWRHSSHWRRLQRAGLEGSGPCQGFINEEPERSRAVNNLRGHWAFRPSGEVAEPLIRSCLTSAELVPQRNWTVHSGERSFRICAAAPNSCAAHMI